VTDGMSFSSLNRTRLELVPFLRDADGNRWFDHNRNADPFTNYVLTLGNAWSIHDDPAVCASPSPPGWMGNVVARISRDTSAACDGGSPLGDTLDYGTWARERAAVRNVCFEVWQPGVTDWNNPDQWRLLDVQAHYRFSPSSPWQTAYVNSLDRVGNNARFAWDLGGVDPFHPYGCLPDIPVEAVTQPDGRDARATMELFFSVNGAPLAPADAAAWQVSFLDNADHVQREARCR
jgi:hypothetical protein